MKSSKLLSLLTALATAVLVLSGSVAVPILCRPAFKPTPSIAQKQHTVRLSTGTEEDLQITGRHDPCIVPRAVPCLEAAAAIAVYDAWLEQQKRSNAK